MRKTLLVIVALLASDYSFASPSGLGSTVQLNDETKLEIVQHRAHRDTSEEQQDTVAYNKGMRITQAASEKLRTKLKRAIADAKAATRAEAKHEEDKTKVQDANLEQQLVTLASSSGLFPSSAKQKRRATMLTRAAEHAEKQSEHAYQLRHESMHSDRQAVSQDDHTFRADRARLDEERREERHAVSTVTQDALDVARLTLERSKQKHKQIGHKYIIRSVEDKIADSEHREEEHSVRIERLQAQAQAVMAQAEEDAERIHIAKDKAGDGATEQKLADYDKQKAAILKREARKLEQESEHLDQKAIQASAFAQRTTSDTQHDFRKEKRLLQQIKSKMLIEKGAEHNAEQDVQAASLDAGEHGLRVHLPQLTVRAPQKAQQRHDTPPSKSGSEDSI